MGSKKEMVEKHACLMLLNFYEMPLFACEHVAGPGVKE